MKNSEIDKFYSDTGYCDNTCELFGIMKRKKNGYCDFKLPSEFLKDFDKWRKKQKKKNKPNKALKEAAKEHTRMIEIFKENTFPKQTIKS